MVCRTAWLLAEPEITEVNETSRMFRNPVTNKWETVTEPLMFPTYKVTYFYDFGSCCGIDSTTEECATREDAERLVNRILFGEVSWIKVDKEFMNDWAEENA